MDQGELAEQLALVSFFILKDHFYYISYNNFPCKTFGTVFITVYILSLF